MERVDRLDAFIAGAFVAMLVVMMLSLLVREPLLIGAALEAACGPCDHVGECGRYECKAGVDGWQLMKGVE